MLNTSTETASMEPAPVSSHVLPGTDVPTDFMQMMQMAEAVADGGIYVPEHLRKKPHNVLAVMLHARALDIPVAVAWKELYVAGDGQVSQSAKLVRALARRAGHRLNYVEHDAFHAVCLIHIKGEPEPHEVRFTMQDAIRMGLTEPSKRTGKGGENYSRQAENMMVARVTTRAVNWYCPEVMLGLPMSADDMLPGDGNVMPSNDTVAAVRQEHRDKVVRVLRLAELTDRQANGVARLALLRELFLDSRDSHSLDFATDDSGEYSVRQVLVEKMREADALAKGQASGQAAPVDPAGGPQTLDDLRGLMEPEAKPEGDAPQAEEPKARARRAAKKTAAAPAKKAAAKKAAPAKKTAARKAPAAKKAAVPAQRTAAPAPANPVEPGRPDGPPAAQPGGREVAPPAAPPAALPGGQPDNRALPCGCTVDDVIINGAHTVGTCTAGLA